jgi:sigma-E factor negative regulatory protein RseA
MQNKMQEPAPDACELASALADGELRGAEFAQALQALKDSAEAQERWNTYHLVGDVMRAGASAAVGAHDAAFLAAFRQRLAREAPQPAMAVAVIGSTQRDSANERLWRWKLAAGLSSVAALGLLGWQLVVLQAGAGDEAGARLAQGAAPVAPVMMRDARLDRLIAEHQQLGGASALQMPAGFLRNATFERPAR